LNQVRHTLIDIAIAFEKTSIEIFDAIHSYYDVTFLRLCKTDSRRIIRLYACQFVRIDMRWAYVSYADNRFA
jgi:hypothetical protein